MKYKKKYEEALDTIDDLKEKLRESLDKRNKLMKKPSEMHEIIEKMEEHNDIDSSKKIIFDLITDNEKLKKSITKLHNQLEEALERLNQV